MGRDSGKGVDVGESGWSFTPVFDKLVDGDGDTRGDESWLVPATAPRKRSSRVNFLVAVVDLGAGLPDRWEAKDLRRVDNPFSANCPEDAPPGLPSPSVLFRG